MLAFLWLTLCFLPSAGSAQTFAFGARAGFPITDSVTAEDGLKAATERYVVGPAVEFHLPRSFAVSADFLYQQAKIGVLMPAEKLATIHQWELPVMLRRDFVPLSGRPFLGAGITFSRIFGIGGAAECGRGAFADRFYCLNGRQVAELRHRGTYGPVIGGGFQIAWKSVWFVPEVRVMRWADRNFGVQGSTVRSNLTGAQFLIGFRF